MNPLTQSGSPQSASASAVSFKRPSSNSQTNKYKRTRAAPPTLTSLASQQRPRDQASFLAEIETTIELQNYTRLKDVMLCNFNPEMPLPSGHTALTLAITKGDLKAVNILLDTLVNTETPNAKDEYPLLLAIQEGNLEIVRALCASGAHTNIMSKKPINIPLLKKDLLVTPVFLSIALKQPDITAQLLYWRADPGVKCGGMTSLHLSTTLLTFEISLLILRESSVAVDAIDNDKETPLIKVIKKEDDIDHFNLLIHYHANLLHRNKVGDSPFHVAVHYGRKKIVARLIELKVSPDLFNHKGITPYIMAVINNDDDIKKIMEKYKTEFSQVWLQQKMLAHRLSSKLIFAFDNMSVKLESFYTQLTLANLIESLKYYRSLPTFGDVKKKLSQTQLMLIWDYLIQTVENLYERQRLMSDGIVNPSDTDIEALAVGWTNHATTVVALNHFLRMNRGEGSTGKCGIIVSTMQKPQNRSLSFKKIIDSRNSDEGKKYFMETVETDLGLTQVYHLVSKPQSAGVCSHSSVKLFVKGIPFLYLVDILGWSYQDAEEECKPLYKDFTFHDRDFGVNKFLSIADTFAKSQPHHPQIKTKEILKEFFDKHLKHRYAPVLDTISKRYPEFVTQEILDKLRDAKEHKVFNVLLGNFISQPIASNAPIS